MKASAERVKASEEKVNASAERVKASEEKVKASAERVKASEEKVNASAERVKASEEKVKASAGRCATNIGEAGLAGPMNHWPSGRSAASGSSVAHINMKVHRNTVRNICVRGKGGGQGGGNCPPKFRQNSGENLGKACPP